MSSKRAFFEFIVPVIVPPLASKFELYCASIVPVIVPVIVLPLASKFEIYCASIVSSKRPLVCLLLCQLLCLFEAVFVPTINVKVW